MTVVQLTLVKDAYRDAAALSRAIDELRRVGSFSSLDARYADRIGLLTGELPEERIADVEKLPCVSALSRRELMRALG